MWLVSFFFQHTSLEMSLHENALKIREHTSKYTFHEKNKHWKCCCITQQCCYLRQQNMMQVSLIKGKGSVASQSLLTSMVLGSISNKDKFKGICISLIVRDVYGSGACWSQMSGKKKRCIYKKVAVNCDTTHSFLMTKSCLTDY